MTQMHQIVVDFGQFLFVLTKPASDSLRRLFASIAVSFIEELTHLRQVVDASFEGNLGRGQRLGVLACQFIFLLQLADNLRIESLEAQFDFLK